MTTAIIVVLVLITASLINLAIQVRKARTQEARASWLASPQEQARANKARAEEIWKATFQKVYLRTGGNFTVACQSADTAARPYFKAAHAAEELARKATASSAVREDIEGRFKG